MNGPKKDTNMRVAYSNKWILEKIQTRMGCDPVFRRDMEMKFGGEIGTPSPPEAKDIGRAPEPAHIDHADPINDLREVVRQLALAIAGLKNGESSSHQHQLQERKMEPKDQDEPAKTGRKVSEARLLAERLVRCTLPGPNGTSIPLKRAEIEHHLMKALGITRNAAQSAATKAVHRIDPGNTARRSHKVPVARAVSPKLSRHIRDLLAKGATQKEVARLVGCDIKTVKKHSKKDK